MNKKIIFDKICKDIKSLKIQGAKDIAKKAFYAYKLIPTEKSRKKLLSLRPTEALLKNSLKIADKISYRQFIKKLKDNQKKINETVFGIIKDNFVIFTHCHSSTVIQSLIYAKKNHKKFEVYNTETRPLYQGRKSAIELKKAGIKVTLFADSAAAVALTKTQHTKKADLVLFGADVLYKKGTINKIGSGMFAQIAKRSKIPLYILSDSLKYSPKNIKIEQRSSEEIWKNHKKINIKNPCFELIKKKNIQGIISELGNQTYAQFLKKVKKKHKLF